MQPFPFCRTSYCPQQWPLQQRQNGNVCKEYGMNSSTLHKWIKQCTQVKVSDTETMTMAEIKKCGKAGLCAKFVQSMPRKGIQQITGNCNRLCAKFVQSMSRKGEPHDNAVAENFFSCLKCELVYLTSCATRRQAQNSIFRYIEGFYNPVRPHSSIGWLSPMEYARQLKRQNVA